MNQRHFRAGADAVLNYSHLGNNEKWLTASDGNSYCVMPDGSRYRYGGELVGYVGSAYYDQWPVDRTKEIGGHLMASGLLNYDQYALKEKWFEDRNGLLMYVLRDGSFYQNGGQLVAEMGPDYYNRWRVDIAKELGLKVIDSGSLDCKHYGLGEK